jgi:hypothetical protein
MAVGRLAAPAGYAACPRPDAALHRAPGNAERCYEARNRCSEPSTRRRSAAGSVPIRLRKADSSTVASLLGRTIESTGNPAVPRSLISTSPSTGACPAEVIIARKYFPHDRAAPRTTPPQPGEPWRHCGQRRGKGRITTSHDRMRRSAEPVIDRVRFGSPFGKALEGIRRPLPRPPWETPSSAAAVRLRAGRDKHARPRERTRIGCGLQSGKPARSSPPCPRHADGKALIGLVFHRCPLMLLSNTQYYAVAKACQGFPLRQAEQAGEHQEQVPVPTQPHTIRASLVHP